MTGSHLRCLDKAPLSKCVLLRGNANHEGNGESRAG